MKSLSSCPVCESSKIALLYEGRTGRRPDDPARWPVFRCGGCSHAFVNPQPSWDELQPYYDAGYEPYESQHGVSDFRSALEEARRSGKLRHVAITPGLRLLDVGCGGGVFLRLAAELGACCTGVEPSEHGVKVARAAGLDVEHGTLDAFIARRPQGHFDLITSNHVVEHHPDPVSLLRQMHSVLSPQGVIWIAVPNGACLSAQRLTWRWHSTDLPYHLHHFSARSLSLAVERAGLSLHGLSTESPPDAVLNSMLNEWRQRWKLPIRLSRQAPLQGLARKRAQAMDQAVEGEALLAVMGA
jgi:2-polyprenyl-3-methyl-5-hydroxy-6-metoxy-1,4-benzoquinol methylase